MLDSHKTDLGLFNDILLCLQKHLSKEGSGVSKWKFPKQSSLIRTIEKKLQLQKHRPHPVDVKLVSRKGSATDPVFCLKTIIRNILHDEDLMYEEHLLEFYNYFTG